jgi:membrane-associated phospholipid phosphatase
MMFSQEIGPKPGALRTLGAPFLTVIAIAVICLGLFGWITTEMLDRDIARFDTAARVFVQEQSKPGLTRAMLFASNAGSPVAISLFALAACGLLFFRNQHMEASALGLSVIGASVLDAGLKLGFHRPRPTPFYGLPQPATFSFPSGHALVATCFFGSLAFLVMPHVRSVVIRVLIMASAVLLPLTIGYSRVYLGVHYASDVLAGYAAGVAWVMCLYLSVTRLIARQRGTSSLPKEP